MNVDSEEPKSTGPQDATSEKERVRQGANGHLAAEILLAEYKQFAEMFRWNEETGERRVNIILTLFTVAGAATALLFSANIDLATGTKARVAGGITLSLFVIGIATLARIVRRNVATDEYKHALDTIRGRLAGLTPDLLADYRPLPQGPGSRLVRFLGLTLFMSSVNAVLLTGSVLLLVGPSSVWISFALAFVAFVAALGLQTWGTGRLRAHLRSAVGLA